MAMASEVTQAHVAAKLSQPSLGLTGKAVRAASPRPGLAKDPAARWGSRFPALQAAHAHCSGSPPPLGVRDCGSPRATLRSRSPYLFRGRSRTGGGGDRSHAVD